MARLLERYRKEIMPKLGKQFGYTHPLETPRLKKIVINAGVGEGAQDPKIIEVCLQELALITGQRPIVTKAKKAISNFKIRKGSTIGCKVTLRGKRMYEFMDRLVNVALPRIRDFRGISPRSFDKGGHYTLGLAEQLIFPEIEYDKIEKTYGMDITFVIYSKSQEESRELLKLLGMPFRSN